MFVMQQLALVALIHSHTYTLKGGRKRYIYIFFFRYTDEEVGHKGVLILIPTHEIMRFPQIFSPDKSRWLCCDRERESARERGREIIPTGVCCAGESNNLYEYVKCATASFEDVRTRWPLPERKWRNQGGSELTWIGYSQQDQREATWAPWIFQYDPFYHQGVKVKYIFGQKKKKCLYVRGAKGKISFANSTKRPKLCREKNEFQESSNLLLSSAAHSQLLRDNSWKHLVLKQQRRSQNNSDIAVFLKDNELR